jgi:ribose transport system ATP-binding protein
LEKKTILKVEHITKRFPGVVALDDVSLSIREGEVLALLGENGAGKSTLIKVLSGIYIPEEGSIVYNGQELHMEDPAEAKALGINVVHQELTFLPLLSVAENLYVNQYSNKKLKTVNWKEIYREAEKALATINLKIACKRPIGELSVAERQQIEIARAIHDNAKVLILDEPTSALNDKEIDVLMNCIDDLRSRGVSVILITHKIEEIMGICDRVVVLRDGHTVAERDVAEVTTDDLVALMVGRKITDMYPQKTNQPGDVLLQVNKLESSFLKNVQFTVRKGEILGIYGLMGSGHLELGEALFGCDAEMNADIQMNGRTVHLSNPTTCMNLGIAFLPSDRKLEGLVLMHSVKDNIMAPTYQTKRSDGRVYPKQEAEISKHWIDELAIKTPGIHTRSESLSGGNQQKVVLAKWLEVDPQIIILNDPTRGIDVGAKAEIYRILNKLTEQGKSVIMITSEMPELLAMSDRVLVMHEGRQESVFEKEEMTQINIVTAAIGGHQK